MSGPKKLLRLEIKKLFSDMEKSVLLEKSEKLSRNIKAFFQSSNLESLGIANDFVFGAYAPMNDESDWSVALDFYKNSVAFPGMKNNGMSFFKCRFDELIVKRDFGVEILSPCQSAIEVTPDLLLMPGRAFSLSGDRLGRGRGYYDSYLTNYGGLKIGICLEDQIVSDVPIDDHDQKVDYLITDKRIIQIKLVNN